MPARSPTPSECIAAEIAAGGPLTFAEYIERALYHPDFGYYASGRARIGRRGDFFTNVSVGPVFGRVLAGQFAEMGARLGAKWNVIEQGAHDGALAADVLAALGPEFHGEYWIVEPAPPLRRAQEDRLGGDARVRWAQSLDELPEFIGIAFSNELVDALPFHLLRATEDGWEELFVISENGGLALAGGPPSATVATEAAILPGRPAGYLTELRPAAGAWIRALGRRLRAGYVLVADYGMTRERLLAPHRGEGTFSCYRGHRRDAGPLRDPGEKDITAHVDFTALAGAAAEAGFRVEGFADQHHFLVGAAGEVLARLEGPPDAAAQKLLRGLQTLLHPESMGTQFHYLAISKGVDDARPLRGFRHAAGGRAKLGLE